MLGAAVRAEPLDGQPDVVAAPDMRSEALDVELISRES
jgi:hypothetical protein